MSMKIRTFCLAAFCLLPFAASAQTVDDVVAKALAARGGPEKIKAVQSERITGTISFGPGAEGPFLVERKRPGKMHIEVTIQGQTLVRTYDGKSAGWIVNPFAEDKGLQAMTANDLKNISDESDFDGPFVDYKEKGNQLELAGKEDVEGKPAYRLKLTNKNGDVSYFFFDASSCLIVKWQGTRNVGDKEVPWESLFHDYREVAGRKYAFEIDSGAPGTDQIQKIVADKIEIDAEIDEAHFGKPALPAPPADPAHPAKPN
jgi:hypothetical protein